MAVNTQRLRFAMMGFAQGGVLLPVPDGDVDDTDRLMLLGFYGGFATGAEAAVAHVATRPRKYLKVTTEPRPYLNVSTRPRRYLNIDTTPR